MKGNQVPNYPTADPCPHGVYPGAPAGPCRICELEARVEELEMELGAWRDRFRSHEYRRINECVALKLNH